MTQRALGILGAVLLVGGIALGVGTGIAASRNIAGDVAGLHAPVMHGTAPVQGGRRQPGPYFGMPGRHDFPRPGPLLPRPNIPSPSPSR